MNQSGRLEVHRHQTKKSKTSSKYIKSLFKEDVRVLYGGGVNEKNIEELNKIPDINGYLIGGASIIPEKFIKIIEVTK